MALDFALGRTRLEDMELHGVRSLNTGRFTITAVTVDGQLLMPTRDFWEDLFKRYRLTAGWAEGKSYQRRFDWLVAHHGSDEIPYRVIWDESGNAWIAPNRKGKIRRRRRRLDRVASSRPACLANDASCGTVVETESVIGDLPPRLEVYRGKASRSVLGSKGNRSSRSLTSDGLARNESETKSHGSAATGDARWSHLYRGGRG